MERPRRDTCCSVCVEPVTGRRRAVECPFCVGDTRVCLECSERYLLGSFRDPHCLLCKHEWTLSFFVSTFPKRYTSVTYKRGRQERLIERERGLLPEALAFIEVRDRNRKLEERLGVLRVHYNALRREMLEEMRGEMPPSEGRRMELRMVQGLVYQEMEEVRERQRRDGYGEGQPPKPVGYVCRCGVGVCRGMVSARDWRCVLCESEICKRCLIPLNSSVGDDTQGTSGGHECRRDDLDTADSIRKETRACPGCATRVYRISGCDQMFCTQCRTPFDWSTGRRVTGVIHNPHYYALQRKLGLGVQVVEVECGIPSYNSIWHATNGVGQELEHEVEVLYTLVGEVHDHLSSDGVRLRDTLKTRVEYLDGRIDDRSFQRRIAGIERRNHYTRETRNLLSTFRALMVDRLGEMVSRCRALLDTPISNGGTLEERKRVVESILVDSNSLVTLCNESIRENLGLMGFRSGPLLLPGQRFVPRVNLSDPTVQVES